MGLQKSRRTGRSKRLALTGAILAVLGTAAVVGLIQRGAPVAEAQAATEEKDAKEKKDRALVAVQAVEQGPISAYVSATANLVSEDEVKVVSEAEGRVVALLVEEGDDVKAGQRLLQIDPRDAELELQKAELALRNAQLTLDRSEKMAADQLISTQEIDRVHFERDVKQHELAEARRRLAKTTVRAAFAGRITHRSVQLGQNVKPADELFTLADFEPLVARIFLPEREVLGLRIGQRAELSLKADDGLRFEGRIQRIAPVVDTGSGTVKVTVAAVEPPEGVRPGAFVGVGIVRETREAALLIPRPAVIREIQDTYVYVADGDVARKRQVQLGLEEGELYEVTGGLSAGELVVTSGQGALKDEAPIELADDAAADNQTQTS